MKNKKTPRRSPPRIEHLPVGIRTGYRSKPEVKGRNADGHTTLHLHDEFNTVLFCNSVKDARRSAKRYTDSLKSVGKPLTHKTELPEVTNWWSLEEDEP